MIALIGQNRLKLTCAFATLESFLKTLDTNTGMTQGGREFDCPDKSNCLTLLNPKSSFWILSLSGVGWWPLAQMNLSILTNDRNYLEWQEVDRDHGGDDHDTLVVEQRHQLFATSCAALADQVGLGKLVFS